MAKKTVSKTDKTHSKTEKTVPNKESGSAGKKNTKGLEEILSKLLPLMSTSAKGEVSYDEENEAYVVNLDAKDETGLLIGKKGETLESIQTVLGVMLKQETGEWSRVIVTAERVKETGQPQSLYNLKPWQRRIVHMYLAEGVGVSTESEGEGEERHLVVKPSK
jgi:spoIIIJ-associated protein